MNEQPIVRVSGRVLLLDDSKRLLLLEHVVDNPRDAGFASVWVPPGGGIEEGESAEDAALRELWEETGLRLSELGPLVWIRKSILPFRDGKLYEVVEQFYIGRISSFEMGEHLNLDEAERPIILGHRWWSLVELESSSELFAPSSLAQLLKPILQGEYPHKPIEIEDL